MTVVTIESYSDLESCYEISSKGADAIAELMSEGIETIVFVPGWMADGTSLESIAGGKTLFVAEVEDYSSKSWLVTQPDGQSEFLAKSQVVVFESASETIDSPQTGLDKFAKGESR
ncbi:MULTISPECIES: hypothetical protein [Haloarcula]|uniref:hypothetical protein n=1 Tax=Haloarcula TaxID=2237 RepID=UPI0023EBA6E2|nr:hypothetical protein [Halomicroarcula sp. XH51]